MSNFFKTKPVVRAAVLPFLFLAASVSTAATDDEVAALKARIEALENKASSTQTAAEDPLSVHGFVNVGVSMADSELTDEAVANRISGGITHEANYQAHQSFGLQVGYQIDDKTNVSAQMLGRATEDNMNVYMNWAYIGRTLLQDKGPMTDLKLRMGRAPADIYMISEYYDVGYAYPWVTPPRESYDLLGGIPYDGIDLAANFSLPADWNMQVKAYVGNKNEDAREEDTSRFDLNDIMGFNFIFERDAWRLRAGYGQASVKYEVCCGESAAFDQLTAAYNAAAGPSGAGLDANITDTADDLDGSFSGAGFSYDDGSWLVMGEYLFQKWDTYNPDMDLSYLTVGKRMNDWMIYSTVSDQKVGDDERLQEMLSNLQLIGGGALVLAAQLEAGLILEKTTYSLGARYDFAPGMTAKVQIDQITGLEEAMGGTLEDSYNVAHFAVQAAF